MATVPPQDTGLPLLYKEIIPLSSQAHATWKARQMKDLALLRGVHALPLTTDEFIAAQRTLPIVFSIGDAPVPLALMGLAEGVNVLLDENDTLVPGTYLPAYARRYPFLLARLNPEGEDLSLCFDPTADLLGDYDEGQPLFEGTEPAPAIKQTLEFCEQLEIAGQRTTQFVKDLKELDLLTDGEVTIQPADAPQPFIYRGFQIVNEEKLRGLRGDQLRKIMQSGMLPLIHAHLFSLSILRELFERQYQQQQPAVAA